MRYSSFLDELDKIAAEGEASPLTGAAALGGGTLAAKSSLPYLTGSKRVYHGTISPDRVKAIREQGLLASAGGSGAARHAGDYQARSRGFVHVSPRKLVARLFASFPKEAIKPDHILELERKLLEGLPFDEFEKAREQVRAFHRAVPVERTAKTSFKKALNPFSDARARMIKADIPVELWEKFVPDEDMAPNNWKGKQVAAKGPVDIPSRYIHGGRGHSRVGFLAGRLKNLPSYIQQRPGRFGLGLAGTLGGLGLASHGISKLRSKKPATPS